MYVDFHRKKIFGMKYSKMFTVVVVTIRKKGKKEVEVIIIV